MQGYSRLIFLLSILLTLIWELALNIIMVVFLARNQSKVSSTATNIDVEGLSNSYRLLLRLGLLKNSTTYSKLIFRTVSLLLLIACFDLFSVICYVVANYTENDISVALNVLSLSIIIPHVYCSFNLTDYLMNTINALEQEAMEMKTTSPIPVKNHPKGFLTVSQTDIVSDGLLSEGRSQIAPASAVSYSRMTSHSVAHESDSMQK